MDPVDDFEPESDQAGAAEGSEAGSSPEPLRLDQFLKMRGVVGTGGQAKVIIQAGDIQVNGQVETRRRRQLRAGDVIDFAGERFVIDSLPAD